MFGRLNRWLGAASRPRRGEVRRPSARLHLEILEDRLAPATFTVTTTKDEFDAPTTISATSFNVGADGQLSLREAIQAANNTPGSNTIILPAGHYALTIPPSGADDNTTGDLNITGSTTGGATTGALTIQGVGPGTSVVDAGAIADRVFNITPASGLTSYTVTFQGLTIQNGAAPDISGVPLSFGGGILASGVASVVLNNANVLNNIATIGGGISMGSASPDTGTLTLMNSRVSGNTAGAGGGIAVVGGGTVMIEANSTISNNTATSPIGAPGLATNFTTGGGIDFAGPGSLNISDSTISGNQAAADGGGIGVSRSPFGGSGTATVTVTASTISGNRATGNGAGIALESSSTSFSISAALTNDTIGGNAANANGGGLYVSSTGTGVTATLLNDTIAFNAAAAGGGVYNNLGSGSSVTLQNTIVADSTSGSNFGGAGTFTSNGGNLSSDASGAGFLTKTAPIADQNSVNPDLGPLQNNGGPTATYALLFNSPAINAGVAAGAPSTDQRGFPRPDNSEAKPDIGAFELGTPPNLTAFALGANNQAAATPGTPIVNLTANGAVVKTANPFPGFSGPIHVANGYLANGDPIYVYAAGAGGGPRVQVVDGKTGAVLADFYAFDPAFGGGVNVALADVNHDGVLDLIVGAGAGGGPEVKVIDGTKWGQNQANGEISNAALLGDFYAFAPTFAGGVNVAGADFNRDGFAEVVVAAGPGGGPEVKVIDGTKLGMVQGALLSDGAPNPDAGGISSSALLADFYAYAPAFHGGVFVATGDFNGDSIPDLITGAGAGGGPHVKVIDGTKLGQNQANGEISDAALLASFYAYDTAFHGGVTVDTVQLATEGKADILTGAGPGGGPHVKVFRATDLAVLDSFYATDPTFTGGVFV